MASGLVGGSNTQVTRNREIEIMSKTAHAILDGVIFTGMMILTTLAMALWG